MMTIEDLAGRWGLTLAQAKRLVRDERVPFVALRLAPEDAMRICWKFIRFEPEALDAWERARRRCVVDTPAVAPPAKLVARKLKLRS